MSDSKTFLEQVKLYDKHINIKQQEVDRLRAMVTKVTPTLKDDVVSFSGSQDKLGDTISKIVDLEEEINQAIDAYVDRKREVNSIIDKLSNSDQYEVLSKKYLLHKSLEQIAVEMNMTYRNVCYIHGEALLAVADLLKGEI
jgi:hypothetical protein